MEKVDEWLKRTKPAKTFQEQLEIMKGRGLIVTDEDHACFLLSHINYYRLRGYTLSVCHNDRFFSGTTFYDLIRLYNFDKKLRLLLMELLEEVEISFRTHIAYLFATKYHPLAYLDSHYFVDPLHHSKFLVKINELLEKSNEIFVQHHKEKYNGIFPVWVALEVLNFSDLSKMFSNMKTADQKEIARKYYNRVYYEDLRNWLHVLSVIRNICAHYGRIYNRPLPVRTRLPKSIREDVKANEFFSVIIILKYLFVNSNRQHLWDYFITNLKLLLEQYSEINISLLGFPSNWENIIHN